MVPHRAAALGMRLRAPGSIWQRHAVAIALTTLMVLGLALRAYGVASRDLWADEAGKIALARGPLPLFWDDLVGWALTPPLYFVLLHGVIAGLGDSLLAYRALSMVAGVATIWATYCLAEATWDRRVGLVAALLVSVSPYFVWHSQDASTYSLAALLGVLAMWRFWVAITRQRTRDWVVAALATALALYVQHYVWLIVFFEGIYVLAVYLPKHRRLPGKWYIAALTLAALYLPHLPILLNQFARSREVGYVGRTPFSWFATLATNTFNMGSGYRLDEFGTGGSAAALLRSGSGLPELVLVALVPVAAGGVGAVLGLRWPTKGWFPVIVLGGTSLLGAYTLFLARHLSIVAVLYFVIMAVGIVRSRAALGVMLLLLVLLVDALSLSHFYASPMSRSRPQDWQGAARVVAAGAAPGDVVAVRAWMGGAPAFLFQLWSQAPRMVASDASPADLRRMAVPFPPSWAAMAPKTRVIKVVYTWRVSPDRRLVETTDPAYLSSEEEVARIRQSLCASCRLWLIYDGWDEQGWPLLLEPLAAVMISTDTPARSPYLRLTVLKPRSAS